MTAAINNPDVSTISRFDTNYMPPIIHTDQSTLYSNIL